MGVLVLREAYFVSDLHLKSPDEEKCLVFLRFLRDLPDLEQHGAVGLFLVGDLFDLWVGAHSYFILQWQPLIEELRNVQSKGYRVIYFEGNHDLYLERYWRDQLNFEVHCEPTYFQISDQTVRVEHGDLMDPTDHGYRFLKWLLHQGVVRWVIEHLPGSIVAMFGRRASRLSRGYTTQMRSLSDQEFRRNLDSYIRCVYQQRAFDWIVTGHCHIEDDSSTDVRERVVRSLNLGWWNDSYNVVHLRSCKANWINLKPG